MGGQEAPLSQNEDSAATSDRETLLRSECTPNIRNLAKAREKLSGFIPSCVAIKDLS